MSKLTDESIKSILDSKTVKNFIDNVERANPSILERKFLYRNCRFSKEEIEQERSKNELVKKRLNSTAIKNAYSIIRITREFETKWEAEMFKDIFNRKKSLRLLSLELKIPFTTIINKYEKLQRELKRGVSLEDIIESEKLKLELKQKREEFEIE